MTRPPPRFRRGTTARLPIGIVDGSSGEFFSPKEPPTVSIWDPNGIQVVTEAPAAPNPNPESSYNYIFDFQIPRDAVEGVYRGNASYLDGGCLFGTRLTQMVRVDPPLN